LEINWRGGRVVEGARLESVYIGNCIEGSNPSLSAIKKGLFIYIYFANKVLLRKDKSAIFIENDMILFFQ
tara:strand:- start:65 stop:274 length:210 start_codon:yes stop_codon:yes gene_type:complete